MPVLRLLLLSTDGLITLADSSPRGTEEEVQTALFVCVCPVPMCYTWTTITDVYECVWPVPMWYTWPTVTDGY